MLLELDVDIKLRILLRAVEELRVEDAPAQRVVGSPRRSRLIHSEDHGGEVGQIIRGEVRGGDGRGTSMMEGSSVVTKSSAEEFR